MREGLRPGGRSARVQKAIHEAVNALLAEQSRDSITVPQIAQRAGVTPTTIYRRWGDIASLLADVAVEAWQPEVPPADHGSLKADLYCWLEECLDETGSGPGRQLLMDVVSTAQQGPAERCCQFTNVQIEHILNRANARGETGLPTVDDVLDGVYSALIYRTIFVQEPLAVPQLHRLIDRMLLGVGYVASQ
ncbi:TetR/AcrR family transcriptional regulator [Pokkaliibacter sp. CJK22405]|uniref:TetR/AcrR family transcriptional regulator n=1 Tax=Pokkaliibacter sp. CJK22405 TaxID=3384615 RepID=UPI0039854F29